MTRRELLHRAFLTTNSMVLAGRLRRPARASGPDGTKGPKKTETLGKQDLVDILSGCTYLGCGGGGVLADGLNLIDGDLEAGLTFRLTAVEEIGDDEYAATAYAVGSQAPPTSGEVSRHGSLPRLEGSPVAASFRLLERHLGKKFVAVIVGEAGPGSVADSLSTAAHLGIPALDADAVGRAAPEIDQYSLLVAGISVLPAAAVTPFGDEIILQKAAASSREEEILRAVSMVSESNLGVTDGAIPGRVARQPGVLVTGTVSRARRLGRAVRAAAAEHRDAVQAVVQAGGGYLLFQGRVAHRQWKDEAGFLVGDVTISGRGPYAGSRYRVEFKNENLIAWRDDEVSVTPPDLISIVATATGQAIPNPEFERGQEVTVVGFKAAPLWRTPRGLDLFGPRHFGYDVPYLPIEERYRER